MPWWGSPDLAYSFASAVSTSLGYPNGGYLGPLFGQDTYFEGAVGTYFVRTSALSNFTSAVSNGAFILDYPSVYAQATQVSSPPAADVPGPLPALGAAAAFGYSRKLRTRLNRSTKTGSGTDCL